MTDQWIHPEILDGEVFIRNVSLDDFIESGLSTARIGMIPYDDSGNALGDPEVADLYPLFVIESEAEEARKAFPAQT